MKTKLACALVLSSALFLTPAQAQVIIGGGGSSAFNAITDGTNTSATMVVGSGASLTPAGSGQIQATQLPSGISGIVKLDGVGHPSAAVADTDYSSPIASGSPDLLVSGHTVSSTNASSNQSNSSYTITASDMTKTVNRTYSSGAMTDTLPNVSTTGFGAGAGFAICANSSQQDTISVTSPSTVNGSSSLVIAAHTCVMISDPDGNNYVALAPGSGSGITQLTGDGAAGPGSGSQPLTLATVNSNVGSFGDSTHCANFTVNAKGLVTAAGQSTSCPGSGGGSGVTFTDGTHTVSGATQLTVTGGTVGGTSPNATLTISGGGSSAPATPQGRLTFQANTPIMNADQSAITTIRYDSFMGNQVPVWNGSAMAGLTITSDEVTMGLSSTNHPSSKLFDVFAVSNSGSLALCTVVWTNGTTRASAISLKSGVWTITSAPTHCWGGASGTTDLASAIAAANEATLLGTIETTGTNGQTAAQFTLAGVAGGASPLLGLSNIYNQVRASVRNVDSTSSYTPTAPSGWIPSDANATGGGLNNRINYIDPLGQTNVVTRFLQPGGNSAGEFLIGVDRNSSSSTPDVTGVALNSNSNYITASAVENWQGLQGSNYLQAMENDTGTVPVMLGGALYMFEAELNY